MFSRCILFDENERNGYHQRECKTVSMDISARYLKLIFLSCYENEYNTRKQIGVVALNVIGGDDDETLLSVSL